VPEEDGSWTLTVGAFYRANNPSDGCPNGFGQEDTIREIFLGKNHPEDPALTGCVVPSTTAVTKKTTKVTALSTTKVPEADTTKPIIGTTVSSASTTAKTTNTDAVVSSTEAPTTPTATGVGEMVTTTDISMPADTDPEPSSVPWWLIVGVAAGVVAVGGIVALLVAKRRKGK